MRKVIFIGECSLDIMFPASTDKSGLIATTAMPGGRLLNASALLGQKGLDVTFVSEMARDRVGDAIAGFLTANGVHTESIDRYTDGSTSVNIFFPDDGPQRPASAVVYRNSPENDFDTIWPRIDPDDIVVFGTYFSIDPRVRQQLQNLLKYATERRSMTIYLPGFLPSQAPRITKVMPYIIENLEAADIVLTRTADIQTIFGTTNAEECFEKHIRFYADTYINADAARHNVTCFHRNEKAVAETPEANQSLMWNAGTLSGLISALIDLDIRSTVGIDSDAMARIADRMATEAKSAADKAPIDH